MTGHESWWRSRVRLRILLLLLTTTSACAYEQVLPWKDVEAEAIVPPDISFSDLDVDTTFEVPLEIEASPDSTTTGSPETTPDVDLEADLDIPPAPDTTAGPDTTPDAMPEAETRPEVTTPECGDGECNGDEDCLSCNDCVCPQRCGGDLFLSEYVEGTSWNKAIEIGNFTGRDVDLQGYALWKITNGGDWNEGASRAVRPTGVLGHGDVFVVCHGDSDPLILAQCDLTTTGDFAEFNGDDAIALVRNGALIDVIGSDGADPGSGWAIAGVPNATVDHTLRRRVDVIEGSDTWAASEPTWDVLSNDVIGGPGGLGALRVRATCDVSQAPRAGLNEVAAATGADYVEVGAFNAPGQQSVLDVSGWIIASTGGRKTLPAGTTVPLGGFRAFTQDDLGFALGLVDRVWLYDDAGALQDVVGWHGEDLAGASYGRVPDLVGDFGSNTVASPNAPNRNPATWCGDGTCGDDEDCGSCLDDCAVCYPTTGDLVITEVMADPAGGPEWFEIVNVSNVPFELAGVVVRDDGSDFHVITAGTIGPGDVLVLASGVITGVAHQYTFSGVSLGVGADQVVLERDGVVIDRVAWLTAPGRGVAWSLSLPNLDATSNDTEAAWCSAPPTLGVLNPTCASCGDAACEQGETCATCAADCGPCAVEGCALDLFISEYVEGSSYNKAIELANFTGRDVDLSRYALWRITNGGSTWAALSASSRVALTGTLAHRDVWVGCNTSSDAALLAHCDTLYGQGSAPTNYNGDDAVALVKDGVVIDVVGADALDPGDGWMVGAVEVATANHSLVRKPTVQSGTTDWTLSATTQWEVLGEDDFSALGAHNVGYTCAP